MYICTYQVQLKATVTTSHLIDHRIWHPNCDDEVWHFYTFGETPDTLKVGLCFLSLNKLHYVCTYIVIYMICHMCIFSRI
jgi:hypothetical protein